MTNTITIRMAKTSDAEELLKIYEPYVLNTAITFEYSVPSLKAFTQRIADTLERYPYIVVEEDSVIAGYAYASAFKERAAYDWAVETSIYVKMGSTGKGYGAILYDELEKILKKQNILNVNACIAYIEKEDMYLNHNSVRFHEHMGYQHVGKFHQCGYKFGKWYDMIWMEKLLGEHKTPPQEVFPVSSLDCIQRDWQKIKLSGDKGSRIIQAMKCAGWYPGREVEIAEILEYYQKNGITLFSKAVQFFKEFSGIMANWYIEVENPDFAPDFEFHLFPELESYGMEMSSFMYDDVELTVYSEAYLSVRSMTKEPFVMVGEIGYYYPASVWIGESGRLYATHEYDEEVHCYENVFALMEEELLNHEMNWIAMKR